jgi:hypothetical protein
MTISDKVRLNTYYTRSVNLERDANTAAIVEAYIPTSRALKTLDRMAGTLPATPTPRAWALVGPYGSGKSSFAVFLSHLLGAPMAAATAAARRILRQANTGLAKRFASATRGTQGHCCVLLTGSPEPLARRLTGALAEAAAQYWVCRRGRPPAIVTKLAAAAERAELSTSELIKLVNALQDAIAKAGGSGLLIVIDELGKFLEFEARHYGANDIFLLQALAEHAYAGQDANLSLVVLLHQAFEQYAKGLGESLKNEWAKVQGRFENIPFLESTEQVLRVVAKAFEQDLTAAEQEKVTKLATKMAKTLAKVGALPSALDASSAADLFEQCYPLHPVSALLLPSLCQKVAQNERTLFSYLGSQETYGFKDSMTRLSDVGDWIHPWEIYEYFILNQPAALTDHFTHRRWAEVVTAMERLGDAPAAEMELLKSIGLLNIIGAQGGFKASREVVGLCLPTAGAATRAARSLLDKSIIQYRKFSSEYRVWQGSDFDIDAAVEDELSKLGQFELAAYLNGRKTFLPIVARKYTIKTGSLRYFQSYFIDAGSYKSTESQSQEPRIVFYLAQAKDDLTRFHSEVVTHFSPLDIVVYCQNGAQLRDAVAEVLALEKVRVNHQELNADPVAQREYRDQLHAGEQAEVELLSGLLENPSASEWYWAGERLNIESKRGMQHELSRVLESVYHSGPRIHNELINRDKISSQAAAARNKLLVAMLHKSDKADLGIDKYPAEKGIYRALLKATGLHRQVDDQWRLSAPSAEHDPYNLLPVWQRIERFFGDTEKAPLSFATLDAVLMAPPYGVKSGVLPILHIAAILVQQHELALYEEGAYTPYLTEELIERFVRRPDSFTVQRFRLHGVRASIFKEYARALYGDQDKVRDLLSIARPLARFMGELPEYTQKTKRISPRAQQVRNAFKLSKSPEKLLFEALPAACGLDGFDLNGGSAESSEGFAEILMETLRELKYAYDELLEEQLRLFCQAFNLDKTTDLTDLRAVLRGRLDGLQSYTVDVDGLRAFIQRVVKKAGDDDAWFANLLMFLGSSKAPKKWADADRDAVEFRLAEYARRINDLEKLRVHYEGQKQKRGADFDVILLRALRQGASEHDEIVCIDDKTRAAIRQLKEDIAGQLSGLPDKELRLALLAEVVDEFLINYRKKGVSTPQRPHRRKRAGQMELLVDEE